MRLVMKDRGRIASLLEWNVLPRVEAEMTRKCRYRRFWPMMGAVPVMVLAAIIFEALTVDDLIV